MLLPAKNCVIAQKLKQQKVKISKSCCLSEKDHENDDSGETIFIADNPNLGNYIVCVMHLCVWCVMQLALCLCCLCNAPHYAYVVCVYV